MVWSLETSNGNETAKIRWELPEYTRGRVLDLGCGTNKGFPHFIGVDNGHHEQFGYKITPDVAVKTCEDLSVFANQSCDAVYSSHLLEHIENTKAALKEWWRVLKNGGHLCLYLPHKSFYPNIGEKGANPDHKHDFLPEDIVAVMREIGSWDLVRNEDRSDGDEYSFFQVFRKLSGGKCVESYKNPKPEKTACICRFGAFGDNLMASSVAAGLKKQGFHVTYIGSEPGLDVIRHDPRIDKFITLDKDQVPNASLPEYWAHLKKKYDRFVNLSESVEGTLLALPGRLNDTWPDAVRRKMMGSVNYLEFQHDLAGVPHEPAVKFYATDEEKAWARKQRAQMGPFVILWSLAGSSVHKTWAGLDQVMARIFLTFPEANVVLCGGPECVILEAGWENERRVLCTSGKWSIRQSLAFLEVADLVIGPETGVMNGASCMDVPKIIFLSHSSHTNLTRDWVNCHPLHADASVKCYPCVRLHYGWARCNKDEEAGVAKCQSNISPDAVWAVVERVMAGKLKKRAA